MSSTTSASPSRPCAVAFYSDKASIFRVVDARGKQARGDTQFGRALSELNIDVSGYLLGHRSTHPRSRRPAPARAGEG